MKLYKLDSRVYKSNPSKGHQNRFKLSWCSKWIKISTALDRCILGTETTDKDLRKRPKL